MRTGVVFAGVSLMVVGLLLLSITIISFGGNIGAALDLTSILSGILNPHAEASVNLIAFTPQLAGFGMIFVGFLVFIAGLAASPTVKPQPPTIITTLPPTETKVFAICPNCKARVPEESKYCSECGTDLKPKAVKT